MTNYTLTLGQFKDFSKKFIKEMDKLGININNVLSKDLTKRMRLRLSSGLSGSSSGYLYNQTDKWKKQGNNLKLSLPRYTEFVEYGFTPHWIPIEFITQQFTNPNSVGKFVQNPKSWVISNPSNAIGFIQNSISSMEENQSQIIEREIANVIAKSL